MAWLQIGPRRFGPLRAILFDKDGTLANSEAFLMALAAARLATALQQGAELTPPLSGVRQLLDRAQDLGLPCGIISGDCRQGIEDFLRHWGLFGAITGFRGSDQLPAKPAAQAALHLCHDLGVAPGHCLLCGDSGQDLAMARAAGVGVVVGYTGGWRNPPQLYGFDALVADWGAVTLTAST